MTRGCGNDPRTTLTPTDTQAVAAFRAYLTARKTVADYEASAGFVQRADGRPTAESLLALVDRAERGALLPEEAGLLRAGVRALAGGGVANGPESPAEAPEAPGPRRDAAGRSAGDGAGFSGPGRASSAGRSGDSPASEAENALRGGSPGLAATARPSLRPST